MSHLAIIPARGGSKRIPRKNIRNFLGKPIIAYSIEAAINSKIYDEVMVSTDDIEITEIAKKYGAKVPFLRSKETSNDFATTADVLNEVINKYAEGGTKFEYISCLYPTAPFITIDNLCVAFDKLRTNNYSSIFTVVAYSYPPQRALHAVDNAIIEMLYPEHLDSRSQDLEKIYHDAGQFYIFKSDFFKKENKIWGKNTGFLELSELQVQDLDTEIDWQLAELKFKLYNKV